MILDSLNEFAAAGTPINTGGAGTYVFGNVIDQAKTTNLPGNSDDLYFEFIVTTAMLSATGSAEFQLVSDSNANLTTSPVIHFTTGPLAQAALTAGTKFILQLPRGTYKRYIGVRQVVTTAAFTAGAAAAFLTKDPVAQDILPAPFQA
jgi:hypothetical protein